MDDLGKSWRGTEWGIVFKSGLRGQEAQQSVLYGLAQWDIGLAGRA
jgi:hypothetical protein